MRPYIAGPHPWADKFVSRDFGDGFRQTGCRLYSVQSFALAGGLLVYGIDPIDPYRRAASYVDRILKGTPVELLDEPTKRADVSEKRCSDTCVDVMAPEGECVHSPAVCRNSLQRHLTDFRPGTIDSTRISLLAE